MAKMYVCPVCMHPSNMPFPFPPVRRVGTCKKCGHRIVRTIKAIAQAWALFCFLGIWLLLWFVLLFGPPVFNGKTLSFPEHICACGFQAFVAGLLALFVGWVLGFVIGILAGAASRDREITGLEAYVAAESFEAGCVDPRLLAAARVPETPGTPRTKDVCCWHCGNAFAAIPDGATQVRCPRCKAGLGTIAP